MYGNGTLGSEGAYPIEMANQAQMKMAHANPTMRENIAMKIEYHKNEIARLEGIKDKLPSLLDVNLRDLQEAMRF